MLLSPLTAVLIRLSNRPVLLCNKESITYSATRRTNNNKLITNQKVPPQNRSVGKKPLQKHS
jgi:hypothetical protein